MSTQTHKQPRPIRAAAYAPAVDRPKCRMPRQPDSPEADVRKFIDFKGWELAGLYQEQVETSGRNARPALAKMLSDAKAGVFDAAVFASMEGAGCSLQDIAGIVETFRSAGVEAVFIREGIDTSTPAGSMFRDVLATLSRIEGRVIVRRLIRGKHRKAARGGYVGGWLPYGFRRGENGEIEAVPEEATVLRCVFSWATEGHSREWIAHQLQEAGVPTRKGRKWWASTIQAMLRNPFYTGRIKAE